MVFTVDLELINRSVLMIFEKLPKFCHLYVVSQYFATSGNTGAQSKRANQQRGESIFYRFQVKKAKYFINKSILTQINPHKLSLLK